MTALAAPFSPALSLLADLTPDSGLTLRRWTPDEFRRLFSAEILSSSETLALEEGEIVDADSRTPRLFNRSEYYNLTNFGLLGPEERSRADWSKPAQAADLLSNVRN